MRLVALLVAVGCCSASDSPLSYPTPPNPFATPKPPPPDGAPLPPPSLDGVLPSSPSPVGAAVKPRR